jgi:hypothetical protein
VIDWQVVFTAVVAVARSLGNVVSAAIGATLASYLLIPPFRKFVDGRIKHSFDKQLATHKNDLTMLADIERARLQRTLQNSAIVAEKKHEVYRRLFQRLHFAMGRVIHLFGSSSEPAFDTWDREDLTSYMNVPPRFPGTVRERILNAWDTDRPRALESLRTTTRQRKIEEAKRAFGRAWNYFLANELYLPDPIAQKAHEAFKPLEKTLVLAQTPGGTGDYLAWRQEASDRVTELKNLLRAELCVVD